VTWTTVKGWETNSEQGLFALLATQIPKAEDETQTIVEIGSEHGMSASLWLKYNPHAHVYCVEIDPKAKFLHNVSAAGLNENRITWLKGSSQDVEIPDFIKEYGIDILFVDGDHSLEGALADLNRWSQYVSENGIILVHDCACSTNKQPHKMHYAVVTAVQHFLTSHDKWRVAFTVDTTMVLMKDK
jgi:predicted O-methyltransferase YrrM